MVSTVMEIMYTCVAVHVVLSTSADVQVIIKHTVIDWPNCCRDSDVISKSLTEAGFSIIVACTCVIITNTDTVITHAVVLVLVLIPLVVEMIHSCVAVHVILRTAADVCFIIKHTAVGWTNCCSWFSSSGRYET